MAKILYVYNDQVYANITNKCDCNCTFCIRKQFDGVGDADTLWHKAEPSLNEIIAAIDAYFSPATKKLFSGGYGEPTCALESETWTRGVSAEVALVRHQQGEGQGAAPGRILEFADRAGDYRMEKIAEIYEGYQKRLHESETFTFIILF